MHGLLVLQAHCLLPFFHFHVGEQTLVENLLQSRVLQLLADEDDLLSPVTPRVLEIRRDGCDGRLIFRPIL